MRPYDAILFDFDGVLVDSEPVHFECWREVLAPFGIRLEWEVYRTRFIGISDLAMIEDLARLREPPADVDCCGSSIRTSARCSGTDAGRFAGYRGGARSAGIARRLRLAVVSSSGRDEIEPILTAGGIRAHFGALVCREDVTEYKPAPGALLERRRSYCR